MKKNQLMLIIMRTGTLQLFFLMVLAATCFANNINAQGVLKKKASIEGNNQPVSELLKNIEQVYGVTFIYSPELINAEQTISLSKRKYTLLEALEKLLTPIGVTYEIYGSKNIVLNRLHKSVPSYTSPFTKQVPIKGRVQDLAGNPLMGVSITEKGTKNGATTDEDGLFSLVVTNASSTLVFTYIGYLSQEVSVQTDDMSIVLQEDLTNLDEVVVVGYGTQKKLNLTGAVSSLSAEEISDMPVANLSNALAGRLSGVRISQNGGKPGMASSINIRAVGTWNNAEPLYVIDGVVRDKFAFDGLDISEVDNVSILKDGATAAIYGSRAANGVVLVTTKMGKQGKSTISYNGTIGMDKPVQIPETQNAYEQALFINHALEVDKVDPADPRYYSPDELDYFGQNNWNWIDEAWKTPVTTRHAVGVNGGSEKVRYYMGGAYFYATGSFDNLNFKKYNLRGNVEADITDHLTASLNLNTDVRNDYKPYWRYDSDSDLMEDLYKAMLFRTSMVPPYINDMPVGTFVEWHPLEIIDNKTGYNKKRWSNYNAILSMTYKVPFVDGLTLKALYNRYSRHYFTKQFNLPYELYVFARTGTNNHIVTDELESTKIRNDGEFLFERYDNNEAYQFNVYATYNKSFGKHAIDGLFVYEQAEDFLDYFNGQRNFFISPLIDQLFAGSSDPINSTLDGSGSESGRISYVGRLNYNYNDRYIVEGSFRYDGSVRFSPERRWGFFPSLSAAWRISEEDFFHKNLFNELKLRGSIGLLGNDAVGGWQWLQSYAITNGAYFGSLTNGIAPGTLANPNITWEKSLSYNFGIDAGLFNRRINISADAFYRHTYDILGSRQLSIPSTFGATMPAENYAVINSKGFELEAGYRGSTNVGLNYSVAGNLAYAANKVLEMDEPENIRPYRSGIGYNTDRLWGYVATDIIRTQAELDEILAENPDYTIFGSAPEVGMLNYRDIRGVSSDTPDGKIDDNDQVVLAKHTIPPVNYGFSLGLSYKGFELDALFQGMAGNHIMLDFRSVQARAEEKNFAFWNDHWTPDNVQASFPRASSNRAEQPSSFWVRNGAFLRLKNVNLSYNVPAGFTKQLGMSNIRLFFSGINLLLLQDKIKYRDPEAASLRSYPLMRNFSFGLNVSL